MTDKDEHAAARELQAKGAEATKKRVEEAYAHHGTPTPTQEENDLAALGVPFDEHQDDGSGPSPEFKMTVTRQSEAKPAQGGNYATRNMSGGANATREHQPQHQAGTTAREPKKD